MWTDAFRFQKKIPRVLKDAGKFSGIYFDQYNREQECYYLPERESCLMAMSYSYELQAKVYDRWKLLESEQSVSIVHQSPADPYKKLQMDMAATLSAVEFAERIGFEKNQALLSADRLIKKRLNFSPLEEMQQAALIAPVQEMTYTPTELGRFYSPAYSPVIMNLMLQQAGMQERINDRWTPTEKGKPFSEILDVGKAHSDGTPVKQVKWYKAVKDQLLPVVNESPAYLAVSPAYEGGTGQGADSAPADLADIKGVTVADPEKPYKQRTSRKKKQAGYKRQVSNPGRYGLTGYLSILELSDKFNMQRKHIIERLEKYRLIKWVERRKKYILTEKGYRYGVMYDPSLKEFHKQENKRMLLGNAQPVFTAAVFDLF
ncbi:hypothetical protein [Endozoicomonas sp. ALB091]|uniref:hypothetical protein n=1 Tax=Endozoicomonas sp. ALB091 TaxID=3403073 RepID=UPI003BB75574